MLVGIMRGTQPILTEQALNEEIKGIQEIEVPIDSHLKIYELKIPTVTSACTWIDGGCRLRTVLAYYIPHFVEPLDAYYAQRGTIFHDALFRSLWKKELEMQFNSSEGYTLLGKTDGFKDPNTIIELKTTKMISKKYLPRAKDLLQVSMYAMMYELEGHGNRVQDAELYYYAWDKYIIFNFKMNFNRDKLLHLMDIFTNAYAKAINKFGENPIPLSYSDEGYPWFGENDVKNSFAGLTLYKEKWECQYCPYSFICEAGIKNLKKNLKQNKIGSPYMQRYNTIVGYDTKYFPELWQRYNVPDIFILSNSDYGLYSGWEEEKAMYNESKTAYQNVTNLLDQYLPS